MGTRGAAVVSIPLLLDPGCSQPLSVRRPAARARTDRRRDQPARADAALSRFGVDSRARSAGTTESPSADITRLRNSTVVEAAIIVLAVCFSVLIRTVGNAGIHGSSWQRLGEAITPAGWWYILISLPVLYFFLACWLWLFLLWGWFLFRTSRLDLELTPTHPDRAGGLGFLGWGMVSFGLVVLAVSAVLSGSLAREIIHEGSSLADVKYHVIIFVIIILAILHAPLLVFTGKLARCRYRGLLDFGNLIWSHDHEFDEKWIRNQGRRSESERLLGKSRRCFAGCDFSCFRTHRRDALDAFRQERIDGACRGGGASHDPAAGDVHSAR